MLEAKFNRIKNILMVVLVTLFVTSCATKEDIVYFQDADLAHVSKSINTYTPTIEANDLVNIIVTALDIDAARSFNLISSVTTSTSGESQRQGLPYLVDNDGNIEFPVLGTLKLGGLNIVQAKSLIKNQLKDYIKNPIVNITIANFKVTVLGEVNNPGTFVVDNARISIIEALGLAGDMTIFGKRSNVLVVREQENNKKTYIRVNLTSEEVFNSPVYYLKQNDVIYIEPNKTRIKTSASVSNTTTTTISILSTVITITALLLR